MRSISILRGKFFLMLRSSYYIGCRLLYHLLKACGEEPECRYGPWNHTLSVSLQPLPPPAPHSIRIVSLNLRMLLGSSAGLSGWRAGNPEQSRLGGGAALLYRHYTQAFECDDVIRRAHVSRSREQQPTGILEQVLSRRGFLIVDAG